MILSLKPFRATGISMNVVSIADPALDVVGDVESANNQCACGRLPKVLSTINMQNILKPVRELMSDDIHDQVQSLPIGGCPRKYIADVCRRVRNHCRCVQMIRCIRARNLKHYGCESETGQHEPAIGEYRSQRLHTHFASSIISSGISSGKNSFAPG